jgi:hypothetical protein
MQTSGRARSPPNGPWQWASGPRKGPREDGPVEPPDTFGCWRAHARAARLKYRMAGLEDHADPCDVPIAWQSRAVTVHAPAKARVLDICGIEHFIVDVEHRSFRPELAGQLSGDWWRATSLPGAVRRRTHLERRRPRFNGIA